ncbi:MAG: PucR family transcriptional regulator [Firmicutes bacterium]|nr:PucR family transcriptional regulator [Bacillota bacterium]
MAEALQVGKLRRARVLAGHQGLGRMIEHVDVIEMPDIRPWVKPNILYLTSFYAIRDNPAAQQDLIRYLAGHGAAALVLDTQSFLRGAPAEVLRAADACHFPVIEIPEDASYIDIITPVLEAVFSRRRSREDFLEDLLQGNLDPEVIRQRAGYLGWKLVGKRTVLVVDLDDFQSFCLSGRLTEQAIQEVKRHFLAEVEETTRRVLPGQHIVGPRSDSAVIVAEPPDVTGRLPSSADCPRPLPPQVRAVIEDLARKVKEATARVLPGITVSVAVGLLCDSPSQIASSFQAASAALELTRNPGRGDRVIFYQDLGIHRLLLRMGPLAELERFVEEEIGPLIEHDRRHGSQFVHTLEVFLDCGCRLEKAAARLYVHRNSLKYRLTRIKKLLRVDELEGERLSSLALAVKAHRVMTRHHSTPA